MPQPLTIPTQIIAAFRLHQSGCTITPFGSGLINNTWLVQCAARQYILQRINAHVFKKPRLIADNIERIGTYLLRQAPDYTFIHPEKTTGGETMYHLEGEGWFRLFPFVEGSHTIDVVSSPEEAFEAAAQFGTFTQVLRGYDSQTLHLTLPDFHNLELRFRHFNDSLRQAPAKRLKQANDLIQFLLNQEPIVAEYKAIRVSPHFKKRVTHHDTKISNVLFDACSRGICVIDLDTVMPGYFISDVGDMMRTYLSPANEEERDFSKIDIRNEYFTAIVQGYLQAMQDELTETEKQHFVYAGKFMIYMQALRFATDYFNNDAYYGQAYEGHNYMRALNQVTLLQRLIEKESQLQEETATLFSKTVSV